MSKQEIDFLFGYIPGTNADADRWLYPPIQILEDLCDSWNGDWNTTMEQIFTSIYSEIERDPPSATPRRGTVGKVAYGILILVEQRKNS